MDHHREQEPSPREGTTGHCSIDRYHQTFCWMAQIEYTKVVSTLCLQRANSTTYHLRDLDNLPL